MSDRDTLAEMVEGRIVLEPWDLAMFQPSSIDMRFDRFFRMFGNHRYPYIDPAERQPEPTRLIEVGDEKASVLHPGEFVFSPTWEQVSLPVMVAARLEGKLSLDRLGLLTHPTAGFVDSGPFGRVILELSNMAMPPVKLWPGMRIGQLCFS